LGLIVLKGLKAAPYGIDQEALSLAEAPAGIRKPTNETFSVAAPPGVQLILRRNTFRSPLAGARPSAPRH
jgi:hypothetical protein